MKEPRTILWDLEFFHINWGADLGVIFCMGWKVLGEKEVHVESLWETKRRKLANGIDDPFDDKALCKRMKEILEGADLFVTYNGIKCDVPFLQTRLIHHGMESLAPIAHKDVYYTAKFKLKLSRNRLYDVQTFFGFKNKKTPVNLKEWLGALAGDTSNQANIIDHCKQDVKVLEDAYLKLRPLMQSHPRMYGYGVCNKCGGELQKNKIFYTAEKNQKITLRCRECRGCETRPLKEFKDA